MNAAPALAAAAHSDRAAGRAARALPLISVVIPVRNDARRLDVCLASLARQDYPADRYEVIVVDNGSTDGSPQVAADHGAMVLSHPGLRVGALRNRGVAAARGELLAFVDSDHEVPPGWLRTAADEFQSDAGLLALGAPYLAPADGTWVQRIWELHRTRGTSRREIAWLASGNLFLRRADFDRVGGFSEDLVAAEDVDLCVRLGHLPGAIVSDQRVANTHHGEPPTLRHFFWKEYWRGSSGLRAFFSHGMPLHELPSLLFPLYHLLGLAALAVALVGALVAGGSVFAVSSAWLWPAAAAGLLVLPAVLLGFNTGWQVRRITAAPALAVLYFVYGLSRAAALFKR
jgi:glycosyltransferase involved in cell wall biosynthesis